MAGILYIDTSFTKITVKPLHPTFGAEIQVQDWNNLDDDAVREITRAGNKYGFCVFRNTGLGDKGHVEFSWRLGELDNIKRFITGDRKLRYEYLELFDAGNIADDGSILDPNSTRAHTNRGNQLFHTDSSYNFRRASFSLLRAVELPPKGTGGSTEFADTRTAFVDLPDSLKKDLVKNNYVGCHTLAQSRKLGSPEYFKDLDPTKFPVARHRLAQIHEGSGRVNLYVGAHLHHIEGLSDDESVKLRDTLNKHVTQPKYVYTFDWEQPGDMVMWDNRATLHRAMSGSFAGKYRRDLRRTTVHDESANAWGLNDAEGVTALGYQLSDKTLGTPEVTPATSTPAPVAAVSVETIDAPETTPAASAPAPAAAGVDVTDASAETIDAPEATPATSTPAPAAAAVDVAAASTETLDAPETAPAASTPAPVPAASAETLDAQDTTPVPVAVASTETLDTQETTPAASESAPAAVDVDVAAVSAKTLDAPETAPAAVGVSVAAA